MDNRGGKRSGAGRKRMTPEEKKVQMTIYIKPETRDILREMSKDGKSIGDIIDGLVQELLSRGK